MLIDLIILLVVIGVGLYLLNLIPMDATVRKIVHVVIILFAILLVLRALGIVDRIGNL